MNIRVLLVALSVVVSVCGFPSPHLDCSDCNHPCNDKQQRAVLDLYNKKFNHLNIPGLNRHISHDAVPSWTYERRINSERIPKYYYEAICENSDCEKFDAKTVQIVQSVNMLFRQSCERTNIIWVEKPVNVSIACTCIRNMKRKHV